MLIRQSKNTFIRIYDNGQLGYITNQLTRHDRTYSESGAYFLQQITRVPKNTEFIIDELDKIYDVDRETLRSDFYTFAQDLADHKFVVLGETTNDLDANDLDFSYTMENPKTMVNNFIQDTQFNPSRSTYDFFLQHDGKKPLLKTLQFELTSRCNERCIHCYIPNGKKNKGIDMPYEKFKYILDQFAIMGGLHVTLSGGEALLNKDIIQMLHYCREKDFQISLLTNLIGLTDEHVSAIKDTNVSLVQVSLYSMSPDIHDTITTVKGSWQRTKNAIERLQKANVPVQISCPVMKANKDGYDRVMKYAQSLRMKATTDYIMMAQADLDTTNLKNRLSLEETEKVVNDILKNDRDFTEKCLDQEPLSSFSAKDYADLPLCGVGINGLCVSANGDLFPCAGWQALVIGNVFRQPLQDIWDNSSTLQQIRKIRRKDFPKCLTCEARDYCAMCLVRNFNESGGDMFKINQHFCDVAFLTKRIVEEYKSKGLI